MKLITIMWFLLQASPVQDPAATQTTPSDASKAAQFKAIEIDAEVGVGYGVAVADVDGDGLDDIVLVDRAEVRWYRNPRWDRHVMTGALTPHDHVCIAARDIDGDDRAEIVIGAGWNPSDTTSSGSVHALIPQDDRTQPWEAVSLEHEPTVHRMRWVKAGMRGSPQDWVLVVAPLHGRGNRAGQGEGVRILQYRRPADPRQPWPTSRANPENAATALHMAHNLHPYRWSDADEEGFLVAAREGLFLFEPLTPRPGGSAPASLPRWSQQPLVNADTANGFLGASEVRVGNLPGGARYLAAIEPFHGNHLTVYVQPQTDTPTRQWLRTVVDDTLAGGHAVACADLLGLGHDQIVVGWRNRDSQGKYGIAIYTALDDRCEKWAITTLDDTVACEDLRLADLDKDGDLDVIAAGRASHNLKVYLQQ